MIARRDGERADIERFVSGDIRLHRIVEGTAGNGETAGQFARTGCRRRDGRQIARLLRRDGKTPGRLARRRLAERGILRETFRISFDDIHVDGRARSLSFVIFGNGKRTGIGIDSTRVLRPDRHGFVCGNGRIFHVRFHRIVDKIQADLARGGVSFGRAAAARCDIRNRFRILRRDRQRFVDDFVFVVLLFRADKRQLRAVHVRFIRALDSVVHEAARDGVSFFFRRIRRDRPRACENEAVVSGIHAKRIGGNRRIARRLLRHMRPRRIGNGIQRQIRRDRPALLGLRDFVLSDRIVSGHFLKRVLAPIEDAAFSAFAAVEIIVDILELHGLIVSVFVGKMKPDAAGVIVDIVLRRIVRHRARDGNGHDAAGIFRRDIRIAGNRQFPGEDRVRRTGNIGVRDGGPDALGPADADAAGQIDIP